MSSNHTEMYTTCHLKLGGLLTCLILGHFRALTRNLVLCHTFQCRVTIWLFREYNLKSLCTVFSDRRELLHILCWNPSTFWEEIEGICFTESTLKTTLVRKRLLCTEFFPVPLCSYFLFFEVLNISVTCGCQIKVYKDCYLYCSNH